MKIESRVEVIDGREFKVTVLPAQKPEAVRRKIGVPPEGRMGSRNQNAKVVGARKG